MNAIVQRTESRPLAEAPTDSYRFCLDALIATVADMKQTREVLVKCGDNPAALVLTMDINAASSRAADLAGRLFEKFFDVIDLTNVTPINRKETP